MDAVLNLEFSAHNDCPTTCWYVASDDARDWVDAALEGFLPGNQLAIRILPVPQSAQRRDPIGAVMFGPRVVHNVWPKKCLRYTHLTERLMVPVESQLSAEVTADELNSQLSDPWVYVWHPQAGLVAFEPEDVLTLADLITHCSAKPPNLLPVEPGTHLPSRMTAIYPAIPPTMQMVLREGQDGIGTKGESGEKIPPGDGEARPGVANSLGRIGLSVFSAGLNMASAAGEFVGRHLGSGSGAAGGPVGSGTTGGSGESWLEQLKEWTQRRLEHLNEAVLSEREKEINRLMNLLEMNPDEGLKWALPISGEAHRGMATPSSHLAQRNPNFSLGGLGGGGPADHWDLSFQRQQELVQKYRELANREIGLGRYRRAAYIFAELLADYGSAADVLKQGKHWREAALLYKDKLSNPRSAAECLEQGGFWTEAIELHLELKQYVKAGELYRQLEQEDEAVKCFEIAVSECRDRRDFLGAADLLENKLSDLPRAITSLEDAWPHSNQATSGLRELFSVYQRHGLHENAMETIERVRSGFTPPQMQVALVETLSDKASSYPDRNVKHLAADATRVVASKLLSQPRTMDRSRILQAVRRLQPDDRLLARDCLRFGQQKKEKIPKATPRSQNMVRICFERMIELQRTTPECESIASAVSANVIFQAVQNQASGHLRIFRLAWEDGFQSVKEWKNAPIRPESLSAFAVDPNRPNRVYFNTLLCDLLDPPSVTFPQEDQVPFETNLAFLGRHMFGASLTSHGILWMVYRNVTGELTLSATDQRGKLVSTVSLHGYNEVAASIIDSPTRVCPMHATSKYVYVGLGGDLVVHDHDATRSVTLDQTICRLVGSFPNTRPRLLVSLEQGARIYWDDYVDGRAFDFATELNSPYLAFSRGGNIIAASDRACQIYSTRNTKMELVGELQLGAAVRGVITGNAPEQFGIVQKDGRIAIYSWSAPGN
ncbi:hypothetical protein Pan97_26250 [Bremerella volcania]|uniref:MoxR-vWA-beta-propeller ternary system domain-containing protein n=1 Tax=Bremerella volcania TaxID=2527984 RepID=A0A518C8P5_9BACT|nr:hypothetical protein [Bremerella volcania]QDU75591.1 hypothetical protein Pan97_26250 [Bremerella volcania]